MTGSEKLTMAFFLIALFLLFSCSREDGLKNENGFKYDSLAVDMFNVHLVAFFETEEEVHVPDHLLLDEDTVFIKDFLEVYKNRGTKNNPVEFMKLDSTTFLVVKELDRTYCRYNIYNVKGDSIGYCYLPRDFAIKLIHEDTDQLKIHFYNTHKRILRKYQIRLCEKYKITEDELDSLSFLLKPKIDEIRREFDIYDVSK